MDAVSAAVSLVTLVEASLKIASLCTQYHANVKHAQKDISRLHLEIKAFTNVLQNIQNLAHNPKAAPLFMTNELRESMQSCLSHLKEIGEKLESSKGRKTMSRYGFRALKWPFESKELERNITVLERYKSTFSAALNIDQTSLILDLDVKLDLAEQDRHLAKLAYAHGANFDSHERQHEPYCLPDTRVNIIDQIMGWSADPCQRNIFWLNGMAGTGKSTIARSVTRTLTEQKRFAANFFFSRGRGDLSHTGRLLTTLAIQLASTSRALKFHISQAIAEHDNICLGSMRDQWTHLIYKPLLKLHGDPEAPKNLIFVVDALDECDREEDIRTFIQLLTELENIDTLQLRTLVTSRPETSVQLGFTSIPRDLYEDFTLHAISPAIIDHDISVYIHHKLSQIREERSLHSGWPNESVIDSMVERSRGLFIYAATMCRFIQDPKWSPAKRLDIVLKGSDDRQSPTQRLDDMYTQVLWSSVIGDCDCRERDELVLRFRHTIGPLVILFDSLSSSTFTGLLRGSSEMVQITLESLNSIINVPRDRSTPIQFHPSFRDFLLNRERCLDAHFWIDPGKAHDEMADNCLAVMSNTLKRNICHLKTSGTLRDEIGILTVNQHIPLHVQYACQYWVDHIQRGNLHESGRVFQFFRHHLLHWLEALSLMGKISEAILMMKKLGSIHKLLCNADLSLLLNDATRFILEFRSIAELAPLQVYASALVFCPTSSIVKRLFSEESPMWLERLPIIEDEGTTSLQALEGHRDRITAAIFSPDGQSLASASNDKTIRLWNSTTGACKGIFEGHKDRIIAILFSPDGRFLASASSDMTIRLWSPVTGVCQNALEGHSGRITALDFSTDSRLLASASSDNTIRLWDPVTGLSKGICEGHLDAINMIAFSPDNQLLASASKDKTVRIWEAATGICHARLEGHLDWVRMAVFSPDGKLLASASDDMTIKLCNPATGVCQNVLKDSSHRSIAANSITDSQLLDIVSTELASRERTTRVTKIEFKADVVGINKIVFSPDGRLLASASRDNIIRLWDPLVGICLKELSGHSSWINDIAFSPDSQQLVSASNENHIRLWNPATGACQATLKGHLNSVHILGISPNGQLLLSGSDDKTIRLWDLTTRPFPSLVEEHSEMVSALVFSRTGELLASTSVDRTVRIWETRTGTCQCTLPDRSDWVHTIAFSPNGRHLACASFTNIRIWDLAKGIYQGILEDRSGWDNPLAFSPDSQILASISENNTIGLWDIVRGVCYARLQGHLSVINAVVFSNNGCFLASASNDTTIKIWNPTTGVCQHTLEGHTSDVNDIIFSPNDRILASASWDNTVRLWDIKTQVSIQKIDHNYNGFTKIRGKFFFTQDGSYMILNGRPHQVISPPSSTPVDRQIPFDSLYALDSDEKWVTHDDQKILWLPPFFRPGVYSFQDNLLVLGSYSGRVTFLRFSKKSWQY